MGSVCCTASGRRRAHPCSSSSSSSVMAACRPCDGGGCCVCADTLCRSVSLPPRYWRSFSSAAVPPSSSSSLSSTMSSFRQHRSRSSDLSAWQTQGRRFSAVYSSSALNRSMGHGKDVLRQEEPSSSPLMQFLLIPRSAMYSSASSGSRCAIRSRDVNTNNFAPADTLSNAASFLNLEGHAHASIAALPDAKDTCSWMMLPPPKDTDTPTRDGQLGFTVDQNLNAGFSLSRSGHLYKQMSHSKRGGDGAIAGSGSRTSGSVYGSDDADKLNRDRSRQAFSQLMASSRSSLIMNTSQGEGSSKRVQKTSSRHSFHESGDEGVDLHACPLCSRLLIHRSPGNSHRLITGNSDLPVVGVLVCGHIFHADCLEKAVPDAGKKHDPSCPVCNNKVDVSEPLKSNKLSGGFSGFKAAASEPIKSKLSRITPRTWKGALRMIREPPDQEEKKAVNTCKEKGIFNRSMSKKSHLKSNKDSFCTPKKFGSPAQVSPESQL